MRINSWFIIDWVENVCAAHAHSIALIEDDTGVSITYQKLHQRITALSNILSTVVKFPDLNNLAPGAPATPLISLLTDRSIGSIIGMLSILKCGAAYVPVDPSFPADRQAYIFQHSKSQLLIVDENNFKRLESMGVDLPPVVVIDAHGNFVKKSFESTGHTNYNAIANRPPPDDCLAYVLYTSGSTGKPKGVMVHNKGLVNVVNYFVEVIDVKPTDRVLGLTTFCFDISMLEIYMPLTTGAAMVIVSSKTQKNPSTIIDCLYKYDVTVMQATPTSYEMIMACGWEGDKNVTCMVGGEACRPKIIQLAHTCKYLYNVYGPTETSIWSSCYRFPPDFDYEGKNASQLNIPIGEPISLTSFYIVDEDMRLVKEGDEGELIIGGDGVAVGYLHAPDLTEKRFLPNPFGEGRIYKTGDLVMKLMDGSNNYTFVRRADDQVKVNGYRIELAEVELAIANHEKVAQAVVIVANNALFGFIKVKPEFEKSYSDEKHLFDDVKSFAGKSLMPYMVPKQFRILDTFPTTANGKLDKLTLGKIAAETSPANAIMDAEHTSATEKDCLALKQLEEDEKLKGSMLKFVIELVLQTTGSVPKPDATFAAVGIDSLAALLFRNVLSKSLGNMKIDQNLLYNVNTTIAKFSDYLYDRMIQENPALLKKLQITCGNPLSSIKSNGFENDVENQASGGALQEETLDKALLYHRNMIDGFRGFVAILVLFDHFFDDTEIYGIREHSDTLLFIIMTGFTIEVQNLSTPNSFVGDWNWRQFLWTRALGLFPIYWLTLLLCAPRFYIDYDIYNLSDKRATVSVICYFLAVQTWSKQINTDLFYGVYYVSLIWGTFMVYSYLRAIYQTTQMNRWMKGIAFLAFVGFAIGMSMYSAVGYFHPFFGCAYFFMGMIVARVYNYGRNYFPLRLSSTNFAYPMASDLAVQKSVWSIVYTWIRPFVDNYRLFDARIQQDAHYLVPPHTIPNNGDSSATPSTTQPEKSKTRSITWRDYVLVQWYQYRLAIAIDSLAFLLLFIMFYHDFPDKNATSYKIYDRFFYLYGNPVIFSVLFVLSLYQSPTRPKSLFTLLLSETYFPRMIGEASYSLYLLQKIIVFFWFDYGIDGIIANKWPYTRTFIIHENTDSVGNLPWVQFLGILLAIAVSVFVQKVFQEKFVAHFQIAFMQYQHRQQQKKKTTGNNTGNGSTELVEVPNKTTRKVEDDEEGAGDDGADENDNAIPQGERETYPLLRRKPSISNFAYSS